MNVPNIVVRDWFQLPATVPFANMTKLIPFLVTRRMSTHVDGVTILFWPLSANGLAVLFVSVILVGLIM